MDYELVKQLKDAGFPRVVNGRGVFSPKEDVYYPTLSELIKACDTGFKFELIHVEAGWFARTKGVSVSQQPTSEEALAKLYLALNQKPNG
jgi:hypothetical protein